MRRLCKSFSDHVICYFGVSVFVVIASVGNRKEVTGVLRRLFQKAAMLLHSRQEQTGFEDA